MRLQEGSPKQSWEHEDDLEDTVPLIPKPKVQGNIDVLSMTDCVPHLAKPTAKPSNLDDTLSANVECVALFGKPVVSMKVGNDSKLDRNNLADACRRGKMQENRPIAGDANETTPRKHHRRYVGNQQPLNECPPKYGSEEYDDESKDDQILRAAHTDSLKRKEKAQKSLLQLPEEPEEEVHTEVEPEPEQDGMNAPQRMSSFEDTEVPVKPVASLEWRSEMSASARSVVRAHKRRDSFHSLGSHVSWTTLLEYAGETPEAWRARKVHRWLGINERDACVFLSELVELREALKRGETIETQAGPEEAMVPTVSDGAKSSSDGWFGWIFGSRARTMTVQAPPPAEEDSLPSQQSSGFFSWLFAGGSWTSTAKIPPTVKPMRLTHKDVIEYHLEQLKEVGLFGRGAFGQVTLVKCGSTGQLLALKAVSKGMLVEMQLQHSVLIEKAVLQATHSPFLVKMAAAFDRNDRLYLLLEALMGGDLYTVYRRQSFFGSEDHARFYAACAVCGFEHLHERRILYRDLKMENLVLDLRGYSKFCDFGTATFEFDAAYTMCGTPEYMPPEVVCGSGHGPAADWWTLGVLIYEMIMAVTPFAEDEPLRIFAKAKAGIDKVEGFNEIQTPWADIVRGLCKQDPAKRLPMLEGGAANVRRQEWFSSAHFNWDALQAGSLPAPHLPSCAGPEDLCNFAGDEQEVPLELPYMDPGDAWDKGFEDPVGPRCVAR